MIRSVIAIIAGYAVFLISSVLLFRITNRDPRDPAAIAFFLFTLAYGSCFGLLAGQITARIAGCRYLQNATIVAALIALTALIPILVNPRAGSPWTELAAILIVAPCVLLGAYIRSRTVSAGS